MVAHTSLLEISCRGSYIIAYWLIGYAGLLSYALLSSAFDVLLLFVVKSTFKDFPNDCGTVPSESLKRTFTLFLPPITSALDRKLFKVASHDSNVMNHKLKVTSQKSHVKMPFLKTLF